MAPKPPSRPNQPHKSSKDKEEEDTEHHSSEEFEDEDDYHEQQDHEDDDDDDVETGQKSSKPSNQPSKSFSKPNANGAESDTDSDSDLDASTAFKLQLIPKPSDSNSAKRTNPENSNGQQFKKPKLDPKEKRSPCVVSGSMVVRVWSKEDEITVLTEMEEFKNSRGVDPNSALDAFYDSIKKKLQGDYSKEQLRTKIKNMRRRFVKAVTKCESGSDPVFSKPHEDLAYDLSKKVWGPYVGKSTNGGVHESAAKDSDVMDVEPLRVEKVRKVDEKEKGREQGSFWSKYPFLSASFDKQLLNYPYNVLSEAGMKLVKDNLNLIGNEKAKDLDDQWKQLLLEEMELKYKIAALLRKQAKIVFDLMKR